jgi:hypothetical protein
VAQVLRMPSKAELPNKFARDFVEQLFSLYRDAHRPPLRTISRAISDSSDLPGTASTETIRRILRGLTVPAHWDTVYAVFAGLCQLANVSPDETAGDDYGGSTRRESLEFAWHQALDNPVAPRGYGQTADDPWAAEASEPPF